MTWHLYQLTFQLKSPLHIGFHKVLHFFRTRPYVPGKLLWGALTAKLTPILGTDDYQKVGDFLKNVMRFGYLYPYVERHLYLPRYTENGLMYDSLSLNAFEKKFISSMASAAIEAESLTAEEGMLHEVEFISPYTVDDGKPVFLKGFIWIREFSENGFELSNNNKLIIKHNNRELDLKNQLFHSLQVGGERKYGFGLLVLKDFIESPNSAFNGFTGKCSERDGEVCISISSSNLIWSHVLYSNSINIKGNVEPLVGRDWAANEDRGGKSGAGRKLTSYGLCWSPGSIVLSQTEFKIKEYGIWEKV